MATGATEEDPVVACSATGGHVPDLLFLTPPICSCPPPPCNASEFFPDMDGHWHPKARSCCTAGLLLDTERLSGRRCSARQRVATKAALLPALLPRHAPCCSGRKWGRATLHLPSCRTFHACLSSSTWFCHRESSRPGASCGILLGASTLHCVMHARLIQPSRVLPTDLNGPEEFAYLEKLKYSTGQYRSVA